MQSCLFFPTHPLCKLSVMDFIAGHRRGWGADSHLKCPAKCLCLLMTLFVFGIHRGSRTCLTRSSQPTPHRSKSTTPAPNRLSKVGQHQRVALCLLSPRCVSDTNAEGENSLCIIISSAVLISLLTLSVHTLVAAAYSSSSSQAAENLFSRHDVVAPPTCIWVWNGSSWID